MLSSCLIVDDEDDENDDNDDNDNYDLCLWPWCRWWRREFEFVNFFEFNWCAWAFFSHQAEVLCNSACNETHSLCVVSHFFQATKTNHGKWVKCDKSCANLWKNQSTLWAKRAAAVRKLRMAGTAKRSTFYCQRYCPVRSELNVHQMWSSKKSWKNQQSIQNR